jgi:hypothetical protein
MPRARSRCQRLWLCPLLNSSAAVRVEKRRQIGLTDPTTGAVADLETVGRTRAAITAPSAGSPSAARRLQAARSWPSEGVVRPRCSKFRGAPGEGDSLGRGVG